MATTKSTAAVDTWLVIAQGAFREGADTDVSDAYSSTLYIDCALNTTTAHTGTEIIVDIGTDTGDADDNWSTLVRFIGVTGTAVSLSLDDTEPIGETSIAMTNPVTANMDNDKKYKFIEHATDANSEIVYQTANSGDAGDTITIQDGLAHEQTSSSTIFDIDSATAEAVSQHQIDIPASADRVRVRYNNNFDPDGSTVFTRCRISKLTGI